jgi:hypothetical protein
MPKQPVKLVGLAAALAALPGTAALLSPATAEAKTNNPATAQGVMGGRRGEPNVFMTVGRDLLGMIVKKGADGIVTADHYSHSSHASHSSHSSHYSSR